MSGLDTLAVHAGRTPDSDTGALLTPIHQTATYAQADIGVHKGHTYSRASNPTVQALEQRLAALEGGVGAVCFSSGMAAIDALLRRLRSGDHVLVGDVVYGGTVRLLREVYARVGVEHSFFDAASPEGIEAALRPSTRVVIVETPANPTLKLADIRRVSAACKRAGVLLVVDNTFLTPLGQRALDLGADVVVHSTTKLIEGHNATIGGAVVVREDASLLEWLRLARKTAGTNQAPFEAWLTLRGATTLGVRLRAQSESALRIAAWLEGELGLGRVSYPFLASHPQHALARAQQRSGGVVISFDVGGEQAARRFVRALRVVTLAESLGGVESLLTHPATMTHGAYSPEERAALGVTDGLLRLSVGLEDADDIIADLRAGLRAARGSAVEVRA